MDKELMAIVGGILVLVFLILLGCITAEQITADKFKACIDAGHEPSICALATRQ